MSAFAGVAFKTPVVVSSGTFGFGREYAELFDLSELGGIAVKGLTVRERLGNPPPRIAETPMGMLNSVGLQNPGVDTFIKEELPFLRRFDTNIIANISGNTVEEYCEMAEKLSQAGVDLIEVNISCPNVKAGGMAFGTSADQAALVTREVRRCSTVPVMIKLSPNVTDIAGIARAAEDAGADALSLINTLLGMRIDIETCRPILKNNMGGLSGPAVFPVALRMVWQVKNAVSIPVMGMGGIRSGNDAVEMMLAGADLVSIGTALFRDPQTPQKVTEAISAYLQRKKHNKNYRNNRKGTAILMTTIYLIRHAEAEGNLYRRIHGIYDSLVTKRGYKQIIALKKRFENIKIDAVYASNLLRTIKTAASIYLSHNLPLIVSPRLREVTMGTWEDRTWGEVERFEPEQLDNFNNAPAIWKVKGSEDYFSTAEKDHAGAVGHCGKTRRTNCCPYFRTGRPHARFWPVRWRYHRKRSDRSNTVTTQPLPA